MVTAFAWTHSHSRRRRRTRPWSVSTRTDSGSHSKLSCLHEHRAAANRQGLTLRSEDGMFVMWIDIADDMQPPTHCRHGSTKAQQSVQVEGGDLGQRLFKFILIFVSEIGTLCPFERSISGLAKAERRICLDHGYANPGRLVHRTIVQPGCVCKFDNSTAAAAQIKS